MSLRRNYDLAYCIHRSGKTTLLLQLAKALLSRAARDKAYPIPVIFHLASFSSWTNNGRSLAHWLLEELFEKYRVPRRLGQRWIDSNQLLALLDGFDEVTASKRSDCIAAINAYHQEHGSVPIVVCSRQFEYKQLKTSLRFRGAVTILPLKHHQVDDYLAKVGPRLATVREVLRNDIGLQKLMTTPLMLNIVTLAYQDCSVTDLVRAGSVEARRQQIFEVYVKRMLE